MTDTAVKIANVQAQPARFKLPVWFWLLPIPVIAFPILYPTASLFVGSFNENPPGGAYEFGLGNYAAAFTSPGMLQLVLNTLWVAVLSCLIGIGAGNAMAWLVARTDIPFRPVWAVLAAAPFFVPSSLSAIGWTILANPDVGMLNKLAGFKLFDVYTYSGVAFVMAQHKAGFVYLMMYGVYRNADPSFEDAARLSGSSAWRVYRTVQLPLVMPVLAATGLITFVKAIENFEVPVIIGVPSGVTVLTSEIYYLLHIKSPPIYGQAIALACFLVALMTFMFALQAMLGARRNIVSITGKGFRPCRMTLGKWKPVALAFAVLYALAASILPIGVIIISSFFPVFGLWDMAYVTLDNYSRVLSDPSLHRAVINTLGLMVACATIVMIFGTYAAYLSERRLSKARSAIEFIFAIPWTMPGLVIGIAMLWAFIRIPGLYGTIYVIAIAYVAIGLPIGLRSVADSLRQTSVELEDASRVHGAGLLRTIWKILLPLAWPAVIAGWFILAAMFSRELAASAVLYGYGSEVISVKLLGYWEYGQGSSAAVVSTLLIALLLTLVLLAHLFTGKKADA